MVRVWIFSGSRRWKNWCFLFGGAALCLTLFFMPFLAFEKPQPIYQGNAAEKKVAFACNVFWGEDILPIMAERLKPYHITFFIGGIWAEKHPDLVKSLAEAGHEIANHSYNHPHPNRLSKEKNQEQILQTAALLESITGQTNRLYAPPYGEFNDIVLLAAQELGYTTTLWSIDTIDWQKPSPEVIMSRVMKKIHPGAIILMHPMAATSQALPGLIQKLTEEGYQITTVSDVIASKKQAQ
ncbi:MAG: polysaccharide deacetylase family protein [Sporomusaceae bacterium]|nr:polysaccharide deacetylase family protein [Sporomusaceae bacterium]